MALINRSWVWVVSFVVLLFLALPAEALPKRVKNKSGKTGAATGAATGATAGGATGATAQKITVATDGSMILDKTVNIG